MTTSYVSQSNLTITGQVFTADTGNCIEFDACSNITVRRCHFTASQGVGLRFNNCTGTITIENCYFDDLNGGIYLFQCTATLVVQDNDCRDVARSGKLDASRGQFIQANACLFPGGLIDSNYVRMSEGQGDKEDHISMFATSGTAASPLVISNNWLRGRHTSPSGGGILIGEGDGNYIRVIDNTIINVGVVGIAIAGGAQNWVQGNLLYSETFSTGDADYNMNSVGMYEDVFTTSGSTVAGTHDNVFVNNTIDWEYYTGGTNPTYFPNAGSAPPIVSGTNTSTDLSYLLSATEPIPDTALTAPPGSGGGTTSPGGSTGGTGGGTTTPTTDHEPMYYELIPAFQQFLDGNGDPLVGGQLFTYTADTSSPKATYREADGLTANDNPIVLDSSGYAPYGVFGTTGAYKLVLKDADDVVIRTRDNVTGISDINTDTATTILQDPTMIYEGKSAVDNGDFLVWQRGAGPFTGDTYNADRWYASTAGAGDLSVERSTTVPTVLQSGRKINYSVALQPNVADATLAATDSATYGQTIEGFKWSRFAQVALRLSFWVRSSVAGVYCISLTNGVDRSWVQQYTIAAAATWEFKELTIDASPSAGTWLYDNNAGAYLFWCLAAGSNFQAANETWSSGLYYGTSNQTNFMSSTDNEFYLAGVQLERGTKTTTYAASEFSAELQRCQRYYAKSFDYATVPAQNVGSVDGAHIFPQVVGASTGQSCGGIVWPVKMRATPTEVLLYNPSAANDQPRNVTAGTNYASATIDDMGERGCRITATTAGGSSAGQTGAVHWTVTADI